MIDDEELPRHPLRLFPWSSSTTDDAKVLTDPESVAMATAFMKKSREKWEAGKLLRSAPVLDDLERVAREIKEKVSLSGGSDSFSSSIGSDSESQTAFRIRSQQSWRKQRQSLMDEAAKIGGAEGFMQAETDSVESSLAEKLLQRGYGLDSSPTKESVGNWSVPSGSSNGDKSDGIVLPQGSHDAFRNRLVEFYTKYNPDKLNTIDRTLETYCGREDELFRKLASRYVDGAVLSLRERKKGCITKDSDPSVYMDISIAGVRAGRIIMRLLKDETPLASENFRCLCTGEKAASFTASSRTLWSKVETSQRATVLAAKVFTAVLRTGIFGETLRMNGFYLTTTSGCCQWPMQARTQTARRCRRRDAEREGEPEQQLPSLRK
uniref:PPIase cyclophilin-type domain-containing protein n=1 Tax=Hyaloperonospora arabidopsidis (strain Emoy2) TaxID=559515 RepID=M4BW12_HYAAE